MISVMSHKFIFHDSYNFKIDTDTIYSKMISIQLKLFVYDLEKIFFHSMHSNKTHLGLQKDGNYPYLDSLRECNVPISCLKGRQGRIGDVVRAVKVDCGSTIVGFP